MGGVAEAKQRSGMAGEREEKRETEQVFGKQLILSRDEVMKKFYMPDVI